MVIFPLTNDFFIMGIFSTITEASVAIQSFSARKLFQKVINIGLNELTPSEIANRIKLVNKLCLLIAALMLIIIPIVLFKVIYTPFILACFILEYLVNASVLLFNHWGKHRIASLTFYFNQCFFVGFFGTLFGGVELQFAIIFLVSVIYLIEKDDFIRTVCFVVAVIDLIVLQGVYWYEVEPVILSKEGKFIIQSLVIGGVMVILFFLSIPYKKSNDKIFDLLNANKHTRTFLAHTVHEVRSPLNAVHLLSHRMERTAKAAGIDVGPIKEEIRMLKLASTSGVLIANQTLTLAEIEAGASPQNEYQSVKIKMLIAEIIDFHSYISTHKKIKFELFAPTFPSILFTDPEKVRQILSNLLTNVGKYGTKNSTCTISLEADHISKEWRITVTNFTESTKEINEEKLFKPFSRGIDGYFVPESSGLGLFICKSKVDELGGKITATKNVKSRTFTVMVQLPLSIGDIRTLPKVKLTKEQQIDIQEAIAGKTVLIADDDEISARALMMELDGLGAGTLLATDGNQLIEMAHDQCPDIILMDYHMPKLNGEAALGILKSSPQTQHIPIVVTSGDVNYQATINRLMSKGADEAITKPIHLNKLTAALARLTIADQFNKRFNK